MDSGKCALSITLEGPHALEASNRLLGGPKIEDMNLTSDPKKEVSEEKIMEVNAETLRAELKDKLELSIAYLPVLGRERIIVKGWSHILAGYPKAGKTELLTRMIAEWGNESVLYVTEESRDIWVVRMSKLPHTYRLNHVTLYFALGASPSEILVRILKGSETIVVIDTIRTFLGFEDETDNSEVNRVLTPYIKAARESKKTLICLHHIRKGGGHYGQGITGAHAFLGTVDIGIELKREKGNRRRLCGQGRVIEVEDFLYERLDDGSFKALGSPQSLSLLEVKRRVLKLLIDPDWKTTKEIRLALNNPKPSEDQVLKALEGLAEQGKVERKPPISKGKHQGATYRWRLAKNEKDPWANL